MKIPFSIHRAKERAESFRRCVELFRAEFSGEPSEEACEELWRLVQEAAPTARPPRWRFDRIDPPLAVEQVLLWANTIQPPPADALTEARAAIEATISTWAEAWAHLCQTVDRWTDKCRAPDLRELVTLAMAEKRRLLMLLAESWPVADAEAERRALADIKAGSFLGLDDAFAQIAGVSAEEWQRRVSEHVRRKQGADPVEG
jgi:hypothetical protein